ncbi:NADPH-dependent 1-acyldihydroxyacetone phosphate reductase [Leucoagaricus sp. SymC.cos]|nr:NADPH-dependent 1-acyldihydroxyacetone phosphate reductase [Leucoagaricus sp. SymC.cos]
MSRVVLVTGCSTGGIGYSLAQEFAGQGCIVYATSRRLETIADFGDPNIHRLAFDVTSDDSVQSGIQEILAREGKLDIVVNNAGMICPGPLIDISLDVVRKTFETNTFSILRVARAVIPEMAKRKQGVIVNMGSIVGQVPTPWNGVYCASKAAVDSISSVLSMECKPLGIKVFHVAPGAVTSNIADTAANNFSLAPDSLYKSYLANIMDRIYSSQGPGSMPTRTFAKEIVAKTLQKTPPLYGRDTGNRMETILKEAIIPFVFVYVR